MNRFTSTAQTDVMMLAGVLSTCAQINYQGDSQLNPMLVEEMEFVPLSEADLSRVNDDRRGGIVAFLEGKGITELAPLGLGTSATVLTGRHANGRMAAVRIPHSASSKRAHERLAQGPVLQAIDTFTDHAGYPVEILPIGPVFGLQTTKEFSVLGGGMAGMVLAGLRMLETMYGIIGYEFERLEDIFVLPNGVPVFTDPDICQPIGKPLADTMVHSAIMKEFGHDVGTMLCQLAWVDEKGRSRQKKFFGPDYLTRPHPVRRGSRPHGAARVKTQEHE